MTESELDHAERQFRHPSSAASNNELGLALVAEVRRLMVLVDIGIGDPREPSISEALTKAGQPMFPDAAGAVGVVVASSDPAFMPPSHEEIEARLAPKKKGKR